MNIVDKYYQRKEKQFFIYGYSPPHSGVWNLDGKEYFTGEDFRTIARFQEYKDIGFNRITTPWDTKYNGENWENSATKKMLDDCAEVGLKVVINDYRIISLTWIDDGIVGENKKFASEKELDAFLTECIKPYRDHPAFFGLLLGDEPTHRRIVSHGDVFRAIKRIAPQIYLHSNLLPLTTLAFGRRFFPEGGDLFTRYEKYLTAFIEHTGSDYIMFDHYPFCTVETVKNYFFKGLEIASKVCKKYNVKLCFVAQSFGMLVNDKRYLYMPDAYQLRYQLNILLGYGIKDIGYFTYWSRQDNSTTGEFFPDGEACMTRNGEKTPSYYHIQKLNAYVKDLMPVLSCFEHEKTLCQILKAGVSITGHLDFINSEALTDIESVTGKEGALVVHQQENKENGERLYFATSVMHFGEPRSIESHEYTFSFKEEKEEIAYYYQGVWHTAENVKELKVTLESGEAVAILVK